METQAHSDHILIPLPEKLFVPTIAIAKRMIMTIHPLTSCRTCILRFQCRRLSKTAGTLSFCSEIYGELLLEVTGSNVSVLSQSTVCHMLICKTQLSTPKMFYSRLYYVYAGLHYVYLGQICGCCTAYMSLIPTCIAGSDRVYTFSCQTHCTIQKCNKPAQVRAYLY